MKSSRNKYHTEWRKAHPGYTNKWKRMYRHRLRAAVLSLLGNKCIVCGFSDERALQIDHINGGGAKELKALGNVAMYRKILAVGGEGYQLLCANHNWIKRAENKEV